MTTLTDSLTGMIMAALPRLASQLTASNQMKPFMDKWVNQSDQDSDRLWRSGLPVPGDRHENTIYDDGLGRDSLCFRLLVLKEERSSTQTQYRYLMLVEDGRLAVWNATFDVVADPSTDRRHIWVERPRLSWLSWFSPSDLQSLLLEQACSDNIGRPVFSEAGLAVDPETQKTFLDEAAKSAEFLLEMEWSPSRRVDRPDLIGELVDRCQQLGTNIFGASA